MFKFLRRGCGRYVEKLFCYLLVLVITPCFFIFEMTVVRPMVIKTYGMGHVKHIFHIICSTFCFTNIVGNMMLCIFTETKLKRSVNSVYYCDQCRLRRPVTAWHCSTCNACVLRRDHHCFFLSRCIGLRNQRYYVLYLGHVFISQVYSIYYNYYYVLIKFEDHDLYLSAFRVINPLLRYVIPEPLGARDLHVLFLFLNAGLIIWSGGLFWFHARNVLRGVTARESKNSRGVCWRDMKSNVISTFGTRWYWTIVWPFVDSSVPAGDVKSD